jgi:hypothetical protein
MAAVVLAGGWRWVEAQPNASRPMQMIRMLSPPETSLRADLDGNGNGLVCRAFDGSRVVA